jgi:catechol 2,3-dioxygenase-like lactoylglutathione lyase family enzyme
VSADQLEPVPDTPDATGAAVPDPGVPAAVPAVLGFDHLVLRVADPERSVAWYCDMLGLAPERVAEWRRGEVPFPSVRIDGATVIDLDPRHESDGRNVDHFCLEVAELDLDELIASGRFEVLGPPVRRWGARGEADLVYVADPDGHVVELRHYGPPKGYGYHASS